MIDRMKAEPDNLERLEYLVRSKVAKLRERSSTGQLAFLHRVDMASTTYHPDTLSALILALLRDGQNVWLDHRRPGVEREKRKRIDKCIQDMAASYRDELARLQDKVVILQKESRRYRLLIYVLILSNLLGAVVIWMR